MYESNNPQWEEDLTMELGSGTEAGAKHSNEQSACESAVDVLTLQSTE
jgi:hypothetical protein